MPKFHVQVPNSLSAEDARERLKRFAETLEGRFSGQVKNITQHWDGDSLRFGFKTLGLRIEGGVHLTDDHVVAEGELPFSVMMFKGKIESEIRKQLVRLVSA